MSDPTLWLIAGPALMAMAAVGTVLLIKIARRCQASRDPRHTGTVPALPLSAADGRRMLRIFLLVCAALLALLFTLLALSD